MIKTVMTCFVVSLFALIAGLFAYVPIKLYLLEEQVYRYLLQEKGMAETEIARLDGRFGKLPNFSVEVVFADEPDVRYVYIEENGAILQLNAHAKNRRGEYRYKHLEKSH